MWPECIFPTGSGKKMQISSPLCCRLGVQCFQASLPLPSSSDNTEASAGECLGVSPLSGWAVVALTTVVIVAACDKKDWCWAWTVLVSTKKVPLLFTCD